MQHASKCNRKTASMAGFPARRAPGTRHSERGPTHCQRSVQKHFLWTMVGPDSSYSPLEIHICWNVLSDDRIEPPIHTEYLRSGGATTLIFIVEGAKAVSSFVILSPMPANIVVPPDKTTFAYRSFRIS